MSQDTEGDRVDMEIDVEIKEKIVEFTSHSLLRMTSHSLNLEVKDKDKKVYALKKIFHCKASTDKLTGVINMHEVHIMGSVRHPYIETASKIYFEDPCPTDISSKYLSPDRVFDRVFFIMPKSGYSCNELVHTYKAPISHSKRAMFQIATAVQYLHSKGMVHRNLKPSNFSCYYEDGVLTTKLADFSTAKMAGIVNRSDHGGTKPYTPPEMIVNNIENNQFSDVWSLACSFAEIAQRIPLFRCEHEDSKFLIAIFEARGSPDEETSSRLDLKSVKVDPGNYEPRSIRYLLKLSDYTRNTFDNNVVDNLTNPGSLADFCDMLEKMLVLHPERRLSINQVLGHSFFSGVSVADPQQFGIWKPETVRTETEAVLQKESPAVIHFPGRHPSWEIGSSHLNGTVINQSKHNTRLIHAIKFHALDIYNRCLLRVDIIDDVDIYKKLAWCSAYISSKYFLQGISPHLWDLFPDSKGDIGIPEIVKLENLILNALEFEIYKPTFFTYLERLEHASDLFSLMLRRDGPIYGKSIGEIMKIYNGRS